MDNSLAFRAAICELPAEIQNKIVRMVREPPPAPRKKLSDRLEAHMKRWATRPPVPRALFH